MTRSAVGIVVAAGLLAGCRAGTPPATYGPGADGPSATPNGGQVPSVVPPTGSSADDAVLARVGGRAITESELRAPLFEAYGLNMLLNLVQLELAEREAERAGVTVTDADVAAERERAVDRMFADSNVAQLEQIDAARATDPVAADAMLAALRKENEAALDPLLATRRVSRPEFDLGIRTNATLAKVAAPQVTTAVNDDTLLEAFRAQYGEKVVVRHIQTNNLADQNAARRRIAAGEAFEDVARAMSTNRVTGPLGGEVPAFTRLTTEFPQSFRDASFALKVGELSEAVQADGAYHVIKLERRIDPTVVKFEDVKESLRMDLKDRLLQAAVRKLRDRNVQEMLAGLTIDDAALRRQFDDRRQKQQAQARSRDEVRDELTRQRQAAEAAQAEERVAATRAAATQAATGPATGPATGVTADASTVPATGAARRPTTTFVDDLLPSTMPAPMPPALPGDRPSSTRPATTGAAPTSSGTPANVMP